MWVHLFRPWILIASLCIASGMTTRIQAEPRLVTDPTSEDVSLGVVYNGKNLQIFGAVENHAGRPFDIVISVIGPPTHITIKRLERKAGLWLNGDGIGFGNTPSYIGVVSSNPLDQILSYAEALRYRIPPQEIFSLRNIPTNIENAAPFLDALIKLRTEDGTLYQGPYDVLIRRNILFSTTLSLPPDLTEGDYLIHIFLVQDKKIVDRISKPLDARRIGLDRVVYDLSVEHEWLYGIISIFLSIASAIIISRILTRGRN